MDKAVNKHIFFISKGLAWGNIPTDRQLEYTQKYILGTCKQVGKLQDWRRKEHQAPSVTPYQMIHNALEARALV